MKPDPERYIFMDAETYYDQEYSLKKMTPAEYIFHPDFELQLMAVREGADKPYVVEGPDFPKWVADAKPHAARTATVTFNSLFDNSLMAWRFGYLPLQMLDAMGMARAIMGHKLKDLRLATVAQALGLGIKGDTLPKVMGLRLAEIKQQPWLFEEFKKYAIQDINLTAGIFCILSPHYSWAERRIMDLVLRCTVEPGFRADKRRLLAHYTLVCQQKRDLINRAFRDGAMGPDDLTAITPIDVPLLQPADLEKWEKAQLRSDAKFIALLEAEGVVIEYKTTKAGNEKPAFAKTDQFMADLENHESEKVQALVAARLGSKSTLEETRSKRLLQVSMLPWQTSPLGGYACMPIPLRISGAHTHRLSGDWKMNMQNLTRDGELRKALIAPPGYKVIKADKRQIEARMNAWVCGQWDMVEAFRQGRDIYSEMATEIFGRKVNRKLPEDAAEGFIGKTGVLGLGFRCGQGRFYSMVRADAHKFKIDLKGMWTEELAKKSVYAYRKKNSWVVEAWAKLDQAIANYWLQPGPATCQFGPVKIGYGHVELPFGMFMRYDEPFQKDVVMMPGLIRREAFYRYGKRVHPLHGGSLLENIVQALARIDTMYAGLRIADQGYPFKLQEHDAFAWIVHEEEVDKAKEIIRTEMCRPPSWAPELPLDIDLGVGPSYGECK